MPPTGGNPSQISKPKKILKRSTINAFPFFYFKLRLKTWKVLNFKFHPRGHLSPFTHTHTHKHTHTHTRGGSRTAAASKVEFFGIIVNSFQPLTIITKSSTLDVPAVLDPPLHTHTQIFELKKIFKKSIINTDPYVVLFNSNIFLRQLRLLIFKFFKIFKLLIIARENLFVASTTIVRKMMLYGPQLNHRVSSPRRIKKADTYISQKLSK